ncbi:E3 ubiquitin-protein ligase SINA-like 10 [Senna tora]|uniref:E3 ubiquitin-protein ligase SINA-like 10 n=1 Tax=Senna tora TaxID=362788 RepID=A0A834WVJ3_9FABA|nr:E3 ubiquitin-protein ligase SINA-like 10 [Senna tora]
MAKEVKKHVDVKEMKYNTKCRNGHIACFFCCSSKSKLPVKICPTCSEEIGSIRNRLVENILEAAQFRCAYEEYGCKETLNYHMKKVHANFCKYVRFSCPCCDYVNRDENLYKHFSDKHNDSVVRFKYENLFSVTINKVQKEVFFLQSDKFGVIFVLNNVVVVDERVGNAVCVVCIGQGSIKGSYNYFLSAGNCWDGSLKFEDTVKVKQVKVVAENFDDVIAASSNYLIIPSSFFGFGGKLKLDIKITQG